MILSNTVSPINSFSLQAAFIIKVFPSEYMRSTNL